MEVKDEEFNIIQERDVKDETTSTDNNNFEDGRYAKGTGVRKKEATGAENDERRKKYFQQYIYQQDYQEALRSLLWEPYDCRDTSEHWFFGDFDKGVASKVPKRKFISSSESSLSSTSSCSSLDEILTVEMTQRHGSSESRYDVNVEKCEAGSKRTCTGADKGRRRGMMAARREEECTPAAESGASEEEANASGDLTETRCSGDPVQKLMNIEIMVSDLHTQNGSDGSSGGDRTAALPSPGNVIVGSASQCRLGSGEGGLSRCSRGNNALNAVGKMLVTVEGTLEPRDSSEDTQLVSPDTSLDVNDSPVSVMSRSQNESGPSGSNVSVVNCYRAVPVAVVSTVPMIKCLNTQENVSNVNIIQTASNPLGKYPRQSQSKRIQPRVNAAPVPSTSKTRPKIQKCESRRSSTLEQKKPSGAKPERERPKSTNVCLNGSGQPARGAYEQAGSVLSNHNRSVSNPVLGNQTAATPNRFGSQQNIPVRLETHFGPASPDGTEHSQTFVVPRSAPVSEAPAPERGEGSAAAADGSHSEAQSPRTFTSTEAQTDDVPLGISLRSASNREQRRRERRERRHQRRLHQSVLSSGSVWQTTVDNVPRDARGLPDILNSHMPPPYSAVSMPPLQQPIHLSPHGMPVPPGPQPVPPHLMESPPGSPPSHQGGVRFPFPFPGSGRRSRGQLYSHEDETPKSCCGVMVTQPVSIRWFIVMIAFVGICCVIVGTVLGAMKASGREHLTVSLLMIGVGIVLVTVSGVAWRLTSQDAPSCRSMLGLGGGQDSATEPNRRFVPRMPPSYGRPHHPYAAMMYPEFQYRPPPPSYQASMQEYRLRLLLLERTNGSAAGLQSAMSPPPTYRSHAGSALGLRAPPLCRSLPQSEYSHPPSYRSRTSSTRPTLDPNGGPLGSVNHSRDPSLVSHVSDQNGNVTQAVVNVISVMGNTVDLHQGETDIQIDSIKLGVDEEVPIPPLRMLLNKGKRSPTSSSEDTKSENVNLVTIVTVSDNNTAPARDHAVESDVLAHL